MSRRMLGTSALCLVVLAALLTLATVGAPAATATVGPYTSWSMRADPGEDIVGSDQYQYDASSGIQLYGSLTRVRANVDGWELELEPARGDVLQPGRTYTGATRYAFNDPSDPGLEMGGNGRGCNTSSGRFTIYELTLGVDGNLESVVLSFEQSCGGPGGPAAFGTVAWHASIPAPPLPPELTVTLDDGHVAYGDRVTVRARLSADSAVREVAVYARTEGGSDRLLTQAPVDAAGRLDLKVRVRERTTFTVRFTGDGTFSEQEVADAVRVDGKLESTLRGKGPVAGGFRLYRPSSDPVIVGVLRPDHVDDCLRFHVQYRPRATWGYDARTKCLALDRRSAAAVRFRGDPRLVGIPIRVRPEWKGDDRNARVNGEWVQFRFIR